MLDIGWTEMAIIAFVALIVIGPKDLPTAMRGVAKWVRKARSLSREFQSGLDEMMRESELDEAKKSIESVRRYRVDELVEKEVDPTGTVRRDLKEIDDEARDRRTASPAPASAAGEPAGDGEAGAKGRTVTHAAQVAPGNSVTPPAAKPTAPPAKSKAAASKTGTAKTGTAKTGTAKTGTAKTGTAKPEAKTAKTGTAKTGTAKTGTAKTGTAKTGTAKTGTAKTGTAKTGTARTAAVKPAAKKAPAKRTGPGTAGGTAAKDRASSSASGSEAGE